MERANISAGESPVFTFNRPCKLKIQKKSVLKNRERGGGDSTGTGTQHPHPPGRLGVVVVVGPALLRLMLQRAERAPTEVNECSIHCVHMLNAFDFQLFSAPF
jgi:hypothetical protein